MITQDGKYTVSYRSTDVAGNVRGDGQIDQLRSGYDSADDHGNAGWIDNAGIARSLQSMLNENSLKALVNHVKAQDGKHISNQAALYLLRDAEYLLNNQE